jgi:hypothetical protein
MSVHVHGTGQKVREEGPLWVIVTVGSCIQRWRAIRDFPNWWLSRQGRLVDRSRREEDSTTPLPILVTSFRSSTSSSMPRRSPRHFAYGSETPSMAPAPVVLHSLPPWFASALACKSYLLVDFVLHASIAAWSSLILLQFCFFSAFRPLLSVRSFLAAACCLTCLVCSLLEDFAPGIRHCGTTGLGHWGAKDWRSFGTFSML